MQLSSLFLSATALLAQAASADYFLRALNEPMAAFGGARISIGELRETGAPVGFTPNWDNPLARITLDPKGNIGNKFVLKKVSESTWALRYSPDSSIPIMMDDITGPFVVKNGLFIYNETVAVNWIGCLESDGFRIYMIEISAGPRCPETRLEAIPDGPYNL